MELTQLKEIENECLSNVDDTNLSREYSTAIAEYLKSNKITEEFVSVLLSGIDIDQGSSFFNYLKRVSNKELPKLWKAITRTKEFKDNRNYASFKILSGTVHLFLLKYGAVDGIAADVFNNLIALSTTISPEIYKRILYDYCLSKLPENTTDLIKWPAVKIETKAAHDFVLICIDILEKDDRYESSFELNRWFTEGIKNLRNKLERERIEARIPESGIDELRKIQDDLKNSIDHYTAIERLLRNSIYQEERLNRDIKGLNKQIADLYVNKDELEAQNRELERTITKQKETISQAGKEIEDRKAINDAFDALKKNDETSLLNDIANDLKAEYRDFKESVSDEMDVQLGEIYREKIINIFKILEKKGIKVD